MQVDGDTLVRAHYEALRRAAYVLTGDVHAADDLVQTALVKALRHLARVAAADDVRGYLHVLLVHTHRSLLRRRWHGERAAGLLPDPGASGRDELAGVHVRAPLLAALGRLSAGQRQVVVLRFMADLTERSTADALGVPVGTVKSRTTRALAALRQDPALVARTGLDEQEVRP